MESRERYTVQSLLFFVEDEPLRPELEIEVKRFVNHLGAERAWVAGPPTHCDSVTPPTGPGDSPVRTLGGQLPLFAPRDADGREIPPETDRMLLRDVQLLFSRIQEFSRVNKCTVGIELNGEYLGAVKRGRIDRVIQVGLLDEWQKALGVDGSGQ